MPDPRMREWLRHRGARVAQESSGGHSETGLRFIEMDPPVAPLQVACPFPLPISDPTALSLLAFFVQHERYHIGQLALLRKLARLPSRLWPWLSCRETNFS